jgi:hypothetical protein
MLYFLLICLYYFNYVLHIIVKTYYKKKIIITNIHAGKYIFNNFVFDKIS